jgi:hypothetical protein
MDNKSGREERDVSCESCLFFHRLPNDCSGECRRHAPQVRKFAESSSGDAVFSGFFPDADPDMWCGEFRHKETGAGLQ